MQFLPTRVHGAYIVEIEPRHDERGFFARTWCQDEAAAQGIHVEWMQCSLSYNARAGTLRGLHYQAEPHSEAKLIRCVQGAAFDVIADLRPGSTTFGQCFAVELTAANRRMVFAPAGCAHGFQTLVDGTELYYQISERYHPDLARGVRWDDPALGIEWPPCDERLISARDRLLPTLGR